MIFVTGGTGFIGAHLLIELAKQGHRIRACKRESSTLVYFQQLLDFYGESALASQIEWVDVDITDSMALHEFMKDCTTVYHAAGKVSFAERDWDKLLTTNRTGTANVVNAALANGVEKLCLFSSVAALDMSKGIKGKKTDWKHFRKHQPYGYSKYLGELEVYRGNEEGLKVLVLNPAVVLGPTEKVNALNKFIGTLKKGLRFYPTGTTGFVSVRDLCKLAVQETEKLVDVKQITVCAENRPFRNIIETFCKAGNFKQPTVAIKGLLYFLAMSAARFTQFTGIRSGLSISGLRALNNQGGYETEEFQTLISSNPLDDAIQDAVRFLSIIS